MGISSTQDNNGAASPLTARSMRLERVAQALAHSQEELRRFVDTFKIIFNKKLILICIISLDVLALILSHQH